MKTVQKIQIAKAAYWAVSIARRLIGKSDRCVVTRSGIRYDLDLSQGIDFAIFLQGSFEPATRRALGKYVLPGSTVIDIGANVGAHTLALAQLVGKNGKVFAFEPTEFAYSKLNRNLELNSELKMRVNSYQCFLGSSGDMPIPSVVCSSWPLIGDSAVHPKHLGEAMSTNQAASRSLDSIWFEHNCPRIQLVKMDVDGFECVVLSGARKLMERDRPIFILELSPYILTEQNASLESLMSYFVPLGYRFYDVKTEAELPQHPKMLEAKIEDGASINAIARPTGCSTLRQ